MDNAHLYWSPMPPCPGGTPQVMACGGHNQNLFLANNGKLFTYDQNNHVGQGIPTVPSGIVEAQCTDSKNLTGTDSFYEYILDDKGQLHTFDGTQWVAYNMPIAGFASFGTDQEDATIYIPKDDPTYIGRYFGRLTGEAQQHVTAKLPETVSASARSVHVREDSITWVVLDDNTVKTYDWASSVWEEVTVPDLADIRLHIGDHANTYLSGYRKNQPDVIDLYRHSGTKNHVWTVMSGVTVGGDKAPYRVSVTRDNSLVIQTNSLLRFKKNDCYGIHPSDVTLSGYPVDGCFVAYHDRNRCRVYFDPAKGSQHSVQLHPYSGTWSEGAQTTGTMTSMSMPYLPPAGQTTGFAWLLNDQGTVIHYDSTSQAFTTLPALPDGQPVTAMGDFTKASSTPGATVPGVIATSGVKVFSYQIGTDPKWVEQTMFSQDQKNSIASYWQYSSDSKWYNWTPMIVSNDPKKLEEVVFLDNTVRVYEMPEVCTQNWALGHKDNVGGIFEHWAFNPETGNMYRTVATKVFHRWTQVPGKARKLAVGYDPVKSQSAFCIDDEGQLCQLTYVQTLTENWNRRYGISFEQDGKTYRLHAADLVQRKPSAPIVWREASGTAWRGDERFQFIPSLVAVNSEGKQTFKVVLKLDDSAFTRVGSRPQDINKVLDCVVPMHYGNSNLTDPFELVFENGNFWSETFTARLIHNHCGMVLSTQLMGGDNEVHCCYEPDDPKGGVLTFTYIPPSS